MSAKNTDAQGRLRSKTVAFRMSPEEAMLLDQRVAISGLTKQDYIISKLNDWAVTVMPSSRVQKGMEAAMLQVYQELLRVTNGAEMPPELAQSIESLSDVFTGLGQEEAEAPINTDEAILSLERDLL